ncbi:MAG: sialidase family protein [Bacteroidota bacterium]
MKKSLIFILLWSLISVACAQQVDKLESDFVFPIQDTYVHGSSLIELPNGDLLSCWFEGSGERNANDNVINGARYSKKKGQWSEKFLMADTPDHPDCNPVLFLDNTDKLWLFWIAVRANRWETSLLKYRTSEDYKKSGAPNWNWQDAVILKPGDKFAETIKKQFEEAKTPDYAWAEYAKKYENMIAEASQDKKKRQMGWMTRIHPLQLDNGRILLPLYSDGYNLSLVGISDDKGKTWQTSQPIVGRGNVQPSIVQKKDGSLVAYMRDNGDEPGRVMVSTSNNDGESWTYAEKTDIPNPGVSVEVIVLASGNWVMAYNDVDDGRYSFAVAISEDEGQTWQQAKHIEKTKKGEGRFAYPSLIQTIDGKIYLTYSFHVDKKRAIKMASFTEEELLN